MNTNTVSPAGAASTSSAPVKPGVAVSSPVSSPSTNDLTQRLAALEEQRLALLVEQRKLEAEQEQARVAAAEAARQARLTTTNEAIKLLGAANASEAIVILREVSGKAGSKGKVHSKETKEQAKQAFLGGATLDQVAEMCGISAATSSKWKASFGLVNKGLGGNKWMKAKKAVTTKATKRAPKVKAKAPVKAGSYSDAKKGEAIKAMKAGASIPSLHKVSGISEAYLAVMKSAAGLSGRKRGPGAKGRKDVKDITGINLDVLKAA